MSHDTHLLPRVSLACWCAAAKMRAFGRSFRHLLGSNRVKLFVRALVPWLRKIKEIMTYLSCLYLFVWNILNKGNGWWTSSAWSVLAVAVGTSGAYPITPWSQTWSCSCASRIFRIFDIFALRRYVKLFASIPLEHCYLLSLVARTVPVFVAFKSSVERQYWEPPL